MYTLTQLSLATPTFGTGCGLYAVMGEQQQLCLVRQTTVLNQ